MLVARVAFAIVLLLGLSSPSLAGEWYAERLRGVVLMMVDGQWLPIERGMAIADDRIIRTGANGQVTFRSGEQIIELARDTQIQISSAEARDYTWVLQAGGELTVDVDAREVDHFGVRTTHLVTVVKGTRFTVTANQQTASVSVERGVVAVEEVASGRTIDLAAGQRATGGGGELVLGGAGDPAPVASAASPSSSTSPGASSRPSGNSQSGTSVASASTAGSGATSAATSSASSSNGGGGAVQAVSGTVEDVVDTASSVVGQTATVVEETVSTAGSVVEDAVDTVTGVVDDVTGSSVVESITGKLF